jgi:hypothetical protein
MSPGSKLDRLWHFMLLNTSGVALALNIASAAMVVVCCVACLAGMLRIKAQTACWYQLNQLGTAPCRVWHELISSTTGCRSTM